MSVWPGTPVIEVPELHTRHGEVLCVGICVAPRDLEALLECLAVSHYPIYPEIRHNVPAAEGSAGAEVEFPAYGDWLPEIQKLLENGGFPTSLLRVRSMLARIQGGGAVQ